MYQIEIDGKQEYSVVNSQPQEFQNVKLYTSSPSYIPFTSNIGVLQNLEVEQGNVISMSKYHLLKCRIILMYVLNL